MGEIYIIKNNINNKVYVGKTKRTSEERWQQHISRDLGNNQLIHQIMKYEGIKHFYYEILEKDISEQKLNEREKYWIKYYNCIDPNGYNQTEGGDQELNSWKKLHPEETKEIIKKWSKAGQEASKKSVIMCDKITEEELKVFPSIAEANVYLGKNRYATGICDCLSGRTLTSFGYKWKLNK